LLGNAATSGEWRRSRAQIPDQGVRRNGQQILLPKLLQIPAKEAVSAHFVVSRNPGVRQRLALFPEHLQRLLVARLELDLLGNTRHFSPRAVLRPHLRQIQPRVDQRPVLARNVGHISRHLAVFGFAQAAAPLASHAHRLLALFGERRRIEYDHAIVLTQLPSGLARQFLEQRLVIPLGRADEVLQVAAVLIQTIGNGFHVLSLQIRNQSAQILASPPSLRRLREQCGKRLDELFQAFGDAFHELRRHFTFLKHRLQPQFKTSLHDNIS
jgi:hypothetical protein